MLFLSCEKGPTDIGQVEKILYEFASNDRFIDSFKINYKQDTLFIEIFDTSRYWDDDILYLRMKVLAGDLSDELMKNENGLIIRNTLIKHKKHDIYYDKYYSKEEIVAIKKEFSEGEHYLKFSNYMLQNLSEKDLVSFDDMCVHLSGTLNEFGPISFPDMIVGFAHECDKDVMPVPEDFDYDIPLNYRRILVLGNFSVSVYKELTYHINFFLNNCGCENASSDTPVLFHVKPR